MKKKLNCIMLIDDNSDDNFFHTRIINKTQCTNLVVAMQSAIEAIEFLQQKQQHPNEHPDIIFLDINMPVMNGWEFLDAYNRLDKEFQSRVVMIMLTTSTSPLDREKARSINIVSDLKSKPLTEAMLLDILEEYFPEYC